MYINEIEVENFRTFRKIKVPFCHADQDFEALGFPRPRLPNLNLLLGDNGHGKTSLLRAIALVALGPAVGDSGIYPYKFIRRQVRSKKQAAALISATFHVHPQDEVDVNHAPKGTILSKVSIAPKEDLETLTWAAPGSDSWRPVFRSRSDAFFVVGYGSTRRVARDSRASYEKKSFARAGRVMGLFEEDFSLRPLDSWLPQYNKGKLKGRYVQATNLLQKLVDQHGWQFSGDRDTDGQYLYKKGRMTVPFAALSDGNRAFLGWLSTRFVVSRLFLLRGPRLAFC